MARVAAPVGGAVKVGVATELVFHGAEQRLEAGAELEILDWSEHERHLRSSSRALLGFVPVVWIGRRRWVPIAALSPLDDESTQALADEARAVLAAAEHDARAIRQIEEREEELRARVELVPAFVERACERHRKLAAMGTSVREYAAAKRKGKP